MNKLREKVKNGFTIGLILVYILLLIGIPVGLYFLIFRALVKYIWGA